MGMPVMPDKITCPDCGRVFDLMNGTDADEWYYGHDCEQQ